MKEITTTKGLVALVDDEDYELVSQFSWQAKFISTNIYAMHAPGSRRASHQPKTNIYMHRLIMYGPSCVGPHVDHRDGNGLNNQRSNLRCATRTENAANKMKQRTKGGRPVSSRYRGVCLTKSGRWLAQGRSNGRWKNLGTYDIEEDAAHAYDLHAKAEYGEFARTNFP